MSCCKAQICPDGCLVSEASPPPEDSDVMQRIKYSFLCPPHGFIERCLTNGVLLLLSLVVPWSILGEACVPGSNIFSLIIVIDVCVLSGSFMSLISIPSLPPLPPLLGMLIAGFCLRNIPKINIAKDIDPEWSSALRSIALSLILVKAGLELDASALQKMKGVCARLTTLPCIVETITCALVCRFLLGFPWEWGFILGFVLGAVSPAVIVPSLLSLQERGYGVDQGIPTLVIAASSFDDVLAISGFSVVLGIAFSQGLETRENDATSAVNGTENVSWSNVATTAMPAMGQTTGELVWIIFRGPVEMLGGVTVGILIGLVLWIIPAPNVSHTIRDRLLLVVSCGVFVLFGSRRIGFPGAGALAAIVLAFVAAMSWKGSKEKVSEYVGYFWDVFEPIMFGLIGSEVSLEKLDSESFGLGVAVIFISLTTRTLATFLAVSWAGFTGKEKLFLCFSWLPKATVQAAIGSVALDTARAIGASSLIMGLANQVLTIAVLSIIITAPLGAAAIGLSGPKLLQRPHDSSHEQDAKNAVLQESVPLAEVEGVS